MKLSGQINLAFVTTLSVVVSLVGVLTYVNIERGFQQHLRDLETARLAPASKRLAQVHAKEGGWTTLQHDPQRFGDLLRREDGDLRGPGDEGRPPQDDLRHPEDPPGPPRDDARSRDGDVGPPRPHEPRPGARRGTDPLELPPRVTLYDADGTRLIGSGSTATEVSRLPLVLEGTIIGYLGVRPIAQMEQQLDVSYLRSVKIDLLIITAAALALGLVSGAVLTRRIVRPVRALAAGTRQLVAGNYEARIGLASADELGDLSRDFDALAGSLAESAKLRRQWVADTSHELRTPLTILRSELEAMLDGVRSVDPAAVQSLHAEVLRLSKLVDSLGDLARSDRGELDLDMSEVTPVPALLDTLSAFRGRLSRRGIVAQLDLGAAEAAVIHGDRARLQQAFANILENAARYVERDGRLRVSAGIEGPLLHIAFDDSGPGVDTASLPRLFERFFRTETSRSSEHGGSGLGLAICQRLVAAHGGTVSASKSPLGGLRIAIDLPLASAMEG